MMRWRLYKVQQQVRRQFDEQQRNAAGGFWSFHGSTTQGQQRHSAPTEGEVKIRKSGATPEKRISEDVGDYVEFEETKNK